MRKVTKEVIREFDDNGKLIRHTETTIEETDDKPNTTTTYIPYGYTTTATPTQPSACIYVTKLGGSVPAWGSK